MLVSIPPTMGVGQVVRIMKSNSGKKIREKFEWMRDIYWGTEGIWSDGYFVSTVGINKDVIQQYIEMQGKEDTGQAKLVIN